MPPKCLFTCACVFATFPWLLSFASSNSATAAAATEPARSTQPGGGGCFNLSLVRHATLHSNLVFIGKILELTEIKLADQTETQTRNRNAPAPFFSETLVDPEDATGQLGFGYYQYNLVGSSSSSGSKRRRHSSKESHTETSEASEPKTYVAKVRVKTVFKDRKVARKAQQQQHSHGKDLEGRVISLTVAVAVGQGNPRMSCLRRLRALDTRIFFYNTNTKREAIDDDKNELDPGDLTQTLTPLPPTLGILTNVRKTVKGEPCEQTHCAHGADCVVEGGRAVCRCPESCASGYAPVCGSDEATYANECLLRQFACRNHAPVRIKRAGECSDRSDPCLDKICPFGARCTPNLNGTVGVCECPPECPQQFDGTDPEVELCGSDGRVYRSECELNRVACQRGRAISVKYLGKCDPCAELECGDEGVCQLDQQRRPVCACDEECSRSLNRPVCASDGRSYTNECLMKQHACRTRRELRMIYRGLCSSGVHPCDSIACGGYETCAINRFGVAECVCAMVCDPVVRPVCGSDMKTYDNACQLTLTACREARELRVAFHGPCDECQVCPVDYDPVCGSNGKSYASSCELQTEVCRTGVQVEVAHAGSCDACANAHCQFHVTCMVESSGPKCVCVHNCTEGGEPGSICGSDGQLYEDECQMKRASCRQQKAVVPTPAAFCGVVETTSTLSPLDDGHCETSHFGCCLDGVTPALSPGYDGCPRQCKCNRLGSRSQACDPVTGECDCFPSVGGASCDRCLPGFWGFPRKASLSQDGCKGCECSALGSLRDDCEQMSGSCECKAGVTGRKCDTCGEGMVLGSEGCHSGPKEGLCDRVVCDYGAECQVRGDFAECTCQTTCEDEESSRVCGSDGVSYDSECLMRLAACQKQMPIWIHNHGPCDTVVTEELASSPDIVNQDSAFPWTQERNQSFAPSGMKSTRHLMPQLSFHDTFARSFYNHRLAISTVEMKSYLGDSCQSSSECVTSQSVCLRGTCVCKEGYYEDAERIQCRPTLIHAPKPLACIRSTCHPESTCLDHLNGTYSCICPLGAQNAAEGCTRPESPLPLFTGQSTVVLASLGGSHKLSIEMELTPFLDHQHAIILFASQHTNGSGDFLSLALIDGHVEFGYDLGDGPLQLRSAQRLQSGTKYMLAAKRYNRDGLLQINDDEEVQGSSAGQDKSLDLGEEAFMGQVPLNSTMLWELVGTSQGFMGCIDALRVGRRPVEFLAGRDPLINSLSQVHQCVRGSTATSPPTTTPRYNFIEPKIPKEPSRQLPGLGSQRKDPCSKLPCKNGGQCWSDSAQNKGFRCVCHPLYTGKLCETKVEVVQEAGVMLDFRGSSYLQLPQVDKHSRHLSLELWFMPRAEDGLLLYSGQAPGRGDFILLHLRQAHVEFLYELGSGVGNVTWTEPLILNKWHWIHVLRNGREARLQVDGGSPQVTKAPPTLSELNLELPLYLGGIPDVNILHRQLEELEPFDGVLQFIRVNEVNFQGEIMQAVRDRLVHKYEGPPCGSSVVSCLNGGSCFPRLASFTCLCPSAFAGNTCQKRREVSGPLRFNGDNFIRFPKKADRRRRVQRQNRIEIVFRTQNASTGVLFWTGAPLHETNQRGFIGLFLSDGRLELRLSLGASKHKKPVILRSKVRVDDGRWHQVLVERRRRLIVFQVDGSSPQRATAPIGSNVLQSDGRVWIGGVGRSVLPGEVPPHYHQGFKGCVDLVRLDKKRLSLAKIGYATGTPFCTDDD